LVFSHDHKLVADCLQQSNRFRKLTTFGFRLIYFESLSTKVSIMMKCLKARLVSLEDRISLP
jgi:hypothetical protein